MKKNIIAAAFLAVCALALAACADHKMPPASPSGGIGSPNGPATGPASAGVAS